MFETIRSVDHGAKSERGDQADARNTHQLAINLHLTGEVENLFGQTSKLARHRGEDRKKGPPMRLQYRGADWLARTDARSIIIALFPQAHGALPPRGRQTAPPKSTAPTKSAPKRRGRPRRSATPLRILP